MEPAIFQDDLYYGQQSELLFLNLYKHKFNLVRTDGKKGDFLSNGKKLELKSDRHLLSVTGNVFIESIRNSNTGKPGGIVQAYQEHQVELFVYWFKMENYYFIFDTKVLIDALPDLIANKSSIPIPNRSYNTLGYKIPAYEILPYCLDTNVTLQMLNHFEKVKKVKENNILNSTKRKYSNLLKLSS